MSLDDAGYKASILLSYDLAMSATAARFNLDEKRDRALSNTILTRLFFDLSANAGIDLFVEAGAREASASRRARKWFKEARVVAFEANPYTYQTFLPDNVDAGIEYLNVALTEVAGPILLNVHRDEEGRPIDNGQASLLKRDRIAADRERGFEQVPVDGVPLDHFFAGYEYGSAALWVDVEGGAGLVLPGARALLAKTSVLLIEVEDQSFWGESQWLREDVVSYLYDIGMVPVARDFEYVYQYNILFVRAELLQRATKMRWHLARFHSQAVRPLSGPILASPHATVVSQQSETVSTTGKTMLSRLKKEAAAARKRSRRHIQRFRKRLKKRMRASRY